jgi:formylglycine-generating enzyme required for sulfatase activity
MKKQYIFKTILLCIASVSMVFAQDNLSAWPEMVKVESGSFMFGANKKDMQAEKDEKPSRKVTVKEFYMSKFEVTVWEWKEFTKASGLNMPKEQSWGWNNDFPITNVTWEQAIEFCNWLSKKQGFDKAYSKSGPRYICNFEANGFRLPTEAEWEFAAHGGRKGKGYKYAGANDLDLVSWNIENSEARPHAYGSKYANELGIFDMNGNVWEWCWDFYDVKHNKAVKDGMVQDVENRGPKRGEKRIVKGGSWDSKSSFCRISNKVSTLPGNTYEFYGLRLVQTKRTR